MAVVGIRLAAVARLSSLISIAVTNKKHILWGLSGVVVITPVLHTGGRRFDPGLNHF